MSFPEVSATFTFAKDPPEGGRYIVFNPADRTLAVLGGTQRPVRSPYDRVQFFAFDYPPFGFEDDPMFGSGPKTWTLANSCIVDVFLDHRDDLPVFTIVEKRGKFCRIEQVGGQRIVNGLKDKWLSVECLNRAIAYGTLELLS